METQSKQNLSSLLANPVGLQELAFAGLQESQRKPYESAGYSYYRGKVRECLSKDDTLYMLHSDRLSAFDRDIGLVPFKGSILAGINNFWFERLRDVVPVSHLGLPHERIIKARKVSPLRVEVIVRGYLAGSMLRAYEKGERVFCGITLPEGLRPYGKLPQVIVTPTSKAEVYAHDENMTADEVVAAGVCSAAEWKQVEGWAKTVFNVGTEVFGTKGWILVDTKYEFGRDEQTGDIFLIDEVHTPDSSRLWDKASYAGLIAAGHVPKMFDKEVVRRYLMEKGFSGEGPVPEVPLEVRLELTRVYLEVYRSLVGEDLLVGAVPDLGMLASGREPR